MKHFFLRELIIHTQIVNGNLSHTEMWFDTLENLISTKYPNCKVHYSYPGRKIVVDINTKNPMGEMYELSELIEKVKKENK